VPIRISGEKSLRPLSAAIRITEFLDSLITPPPADVPGLSGKNPSADLILPSCWHCPDPSYDELARRQKIQGTGILEILVSENGEAKQIRPVKLLGYGLDERAHDVIKTWKFRPAKTKKDGTPVPAIVPVEVAFRLY
jgi:TonB family protein